MSHERSAATIKGQTMDEKETEVLARIGGGALFISWSLPLNHTSGSTSTEQQSASLGSLQIITTGGARICEDTNEWKKSLSDPKTWAVIEVQLNSALDIEIQS